MAMAMELLHPPPPRSPSSSSAPISSRFAKPTSNWILLCKLLPPQGRRHRHGSSSTVASLPAASSASSLMSIISDRLLAGPASAAVSYDDIVSSTSPSSSSSSSPVPSIDGVPQAFDAPSLSFPSPDLDLDLDLDVGGAFDSVLGFVSENPVAVIGGIFAIGLPLLISRLLFSQGADKPYAVLSAKEAFKRLGPSSADSDSEGDGFLLDIRPATDVKIEGVPDLRSIKKRAIQIPYTQDGDDAVFLKKLLFKFKQPSSTTLYILDQFDGNSLSVAKLATSNGFKFAYAIKDGAEGPNGWRKNELPWLVPRKGFSLDISGLKDVIDSTFGESGDLVPASLGVAAAAGLGFALFSEAETALQLLGSAALVQIFVKKFLFAEDRRKTLKELEVFLDTKVAPKELVDEFKSVSGSLITKLEEEAPSQTKEPASDTEVTVGPEPVTAEEKSDSVKIDAVVEETTEVIVEGKNDDVSVDAIIVEREEIASVDGGASSSGASIDPPRSSTPLSPYAQFPYLKPPSPPTPFKQPSPPTALYVEPSSSSSAAASTDSSTPLSPYAQFPYLKPPSPPTPFKPPPPPAALYVDASPSASAASADLPRSSTPLSPYAQFPHLKPPSPPTPFRPC